MAHHGVSIQSQKRRTSPHKKLSAGDKSLLALCRWKLGLWLPQCVCHRQCCNKRKNNGLIFPRRHRPPDASHTCSFWWLESSWKLKILIQHNMSALVHWAEITRTDDIYENSFFFFLDCSARLRIVPLWNVLLLSAHIYFTRQTLEYSHSGQMKRWMWGFIWLWGINRLCLKT